MNLEEICNKYIADEVLEVKPQGSGHINDTYIVKTAACDYVLQRIQKDMDVSHLEHNFSLYSEVFDRCDLEYPKWMKDCDGNHFYIDENNDAWRMYPYIECDEISGPLSKDLLYAYGEGIARMHEAFRIIEGEIEAVYPKLLDLGFYHQKYSKLIISDNTINAFRDEEIEKKIDLALELFSASDEGRQAIIHADTKLPNVLYKDGRVIGFIDFDTIMQGPIAVDVADAIRSCCIQDGKLDREKAGYLVEGYISLSDDRTAEEVKSNLQYTFRKLCFELALRYYIDAISGENYFKDKEPAYKVERARTLLMTVLD